jgi:hypothetical protein
MENLSRMNDPEFELWFCQFLLDRDNSLVMSQVVGLIWKPAEMRRTLSLRR